LSVPAVVLAVVLVCALLLPPLSSWAARTVWAETLSFVAFAVVVPALVVLAAPWQVTGLGARAERLADSRRRHPELLRSAAFLLVAVTLDILWRTPFAVDHLARDRWLALLEAVTLIPAGVALWLEIVESPPLVPRSPRPTRIAIAAVSMWTIWALAYVLGMADGSPYAIYRHSLAERSEQATESQIATGIMWFVAGCAFVPVVFSNLLQWLHSEENPDEELHRLLAEERRRGRGAR
jgi:cytochrome c oxidase assembly factor CtaG